MSEKVLIVIGDAAEVTDTLYPYFRVQEDGYEAVVAAPQKRTYHLVMHTGGLLLSSPSGALQPLFTHRNW